MKNPIASVQKWLAHRKVKRSPHWPAVRRKFLAEHPSCAACGGTANVELHHVQSFHEFPELELSPSNLLPLCEAIGRQHHLNVGHHGNWKTNNAEVRTDAARELARNLHHHA